MSEQHTPRNKIFIYAALACLALGIVAGTVIYVISGKPLPSFMNKIGLRNEQPASKAKPVENKWSEATATPRPTPITPEPDFADQQGTRQGQEPQTAPVEQPDQSEPQSDYPEQLAQIDAMPDSALTKAGTDQNWPDAHPAETVADPPVPGYDAPLTNGNTEEQHEPKTAPGLDNNQLEGETAKAVESDNHNAHATGVLHYNKGYPANETRSVSRGRIELDTPVAGGFTDTVVDSAFIHDLATFLVENYWPRKTHPLAVANGISTAGLRLINMRYGASLTGFGLDAADPATGRQQLLDYVFTPGMIRALYALHAQSFLDALKKAANTRAAERGPLSDRECAEMFAIYGKMAAGLAGCINVYQRTPEIRALVASYADASDRAATDFINYAEAVDGLPMAKTAATEQYRASILLREQKKENLAAAMRLGADTTGLDADSLVYTAMWLHRRGDGRSAALSAVADICTDCSARLLDLARLYQFAK